MHRKTPCSENQNRALFFVYSGSIINILQLGNMRHLIIAHSLLPPKIDMEYSVAFYNNNICGVIHRIIKSLIAIHRFQFIITEIRNTEIAVKFSAFVIISIHKIRFCYVYALSGYLIIKVRQLNFVIYRYLITYLFKLRLLSVILFIEIIKNRIKTNVPVRIISNRINNG